MVKRTDQTWFKFIVKILIDYGPSFSLYQQDVINQWRKKTEFIYIVLLDECKQLWKRGMKLHKQCRARIRTVITTNKKCIIHQNVHYY